MFKLCVYRVLPDGGLPTLYEAQTTVCPHVGEMLAFGEKQYKVKWVDHLYEPCAAGPLGDWRLDEVQAWVE